MKREEIRLSNQQWNDLAMEHYLTDKEGNEVKINALEENYVSSTRHTEIHELIFQRVSDEKYFRVSFETSVKDSMGWSECNYGETTANQVFPKKVTTTVYK